MMLTPELNSYFKDYPIKLGISFNSDNNSCILTTRCWNYLKFSFFRDETRPLTCYCKGYYNDINIDGLFAKIGYDEVTTKTVQDEYRILSKLQTYNFIPKISFITELDKKYCILFTKIIDGVSLDTIDNRSERWKIGISKALDLLYKLYIETGFMHRDMDPNNIMIDINNEVYIIDFEKCYLPGDSRHLTWRYELLIFNRSISNEISNELYEKLEIWEKSYQLCDKCEIKYEIKCITCHKLFFDKIEEYKEILFS